MNHRDRRSALLPSVLAPLLAPPALICVLVGTLIGVFISAAAHAPGWKSTRIAPATLATTDASSVVAEPAFEPAAVLAATHSFDSFDRQASFLSAGADATDHEIAPDAVQSDDQSTTEEHELVDASTHIPFGGPLRLAAHGSSRGGTSGSSSSSGGRPSAAGGGGGSSGGASDEGQGNDHEQVHDTPEGPGTASPVADDAPPTPSGEDAPTDAGKPQNDAAPQPQPEPEPAPNDPSPAPVDPLPTNPLPGRPIDLFPLDPPVTQPVSVPEPGTLGLLLLGLAGAAGARRRRATNQN